MDLVESVKASYGERSMQYSIAAKSAALVGLKLYTKVSMEASLKLLDSISPVVSSGVNNILSITPELKLSPENRDLWLRFAMNETSLLPRK